MANEQQFDLLLEMYLLVTYQPGLIFLQTTYPDEKEKRKSSVVIEYPTGGVDGYGEHNAITRVTGQSVPWLLARF